MSVKNRDFTGVARDVFKLEADAVAQLARQLDKKPYNLCIDTILKAHGRVVVCGVGKSGIIARKISATLASTGTPSVFMHPVEAFHGDLGMLGKGDVVIAISYSGETEELLKIIPFLNANKIPVIALTGNTGSTLAKNAVSVLNVAVKKEACPLELAPTASTTATLAMGDALAVSLMKARNFKEEDFARFHPGGSLGRKLLTTVDHVMFSNNLPVLDKNADMQKVIHVMTKGRLGLGVVLEKNKIAGVITDGDLRRAMEKYGKDFFDKKAAGIMTRNPRMITGDVKMAEAEMLMTQWKITSLLVHEKGKLAGIVQLYSIQS